jgi:hypothetical protein
MDRRVLAAFAFERLQGAVLLLGADFALCQHGDREVHAGERASLLMLAGVVVFRTMCLPPLMLCLLPAPLSPDRVRYS